MQALIDKTHAVHFELYRQNKLEEMGFSDGDANNEPHSLQETYEQRRKEYMQEFQEREEKMRQRFVQKVKDKESELKSSEQEVK
jgi:septin 6/8/11